ncbi:hypothetical protein J3459_007958 [Metarhizium acridum]|nr:hypothetical protein J3459_007958 [Metarhizium acridum]
MRRHKTSGNGGKRQTFGCLEAYPNLLTKYARSEARSKNGYVWTYPLNEQVVLHAEEPANIGRYAFSLHILNKTFCKICGVNLTNEYNADQTEEQKARLSEGARKWEAYARRHHPVNLRVLPEVDIYNMTRRYNKGYTGIPPLYENP